MSGGKDVVTCHLHIDCAIFMSTDPASGVGLVLWLIDEVCMHTMQLQAYCLL